MKKLSLKRKNEIRQHKLVNELRERNKELKCLYCFSEIIERNNLELDEICKSLIEIIPLSWQYPLITCSRILIGKSEYKSRNFEETKWKLSADISCFNEPSGSLEIYYLEDKKEMHKGPFLEEEIKLIKAISERLGRVLERIELNNNKEKHYLEVTQSNNALGRVLGRIEEEKNQIREDIALNIERNVKPIIRKIKNFANINNNPAKYQAYVTAIEKGLNDINDDFYKKVQNLKINMSPTELRICHYVKSGYEAKEIASMMGISVNTVQNHSRNIRAKLGLTHKKVSLKKYFYDFRLQA